MAAKRARLYDALALLTVLVVVSLDQWTKALVVANLSPQDSKPVIPLIGQYLVIKYIQNKGAAFSMFAGNNLFLAILIAVAIGVVVYLYVRMLNTGPLAYKVVFGLIIGGALGNLIDRAHNSGYVVDFISFRIPEINYYFAIFNVADACITVGVLLLLLLVLLGGFGHKNTTTQEQETHQSSSTQSSRGNTLQTTERDV
ncbi:MAG TPA: signal peptidase II [Ktedonosporobacter sp.]|nr:signal peptidase II [Ktedonosporobacter sp.]